MAMSLHQALLTRQTPQLQLSVGHPPALNTPCAWRSGAAAQLGPSRRCSPITAAVQGPEQPARGLVGHSPSNMATAAAAGPAMETIQPAHVTMTDLSFTPSHSMDATDDTLWCEGAWQPALCSAEEHHQRQCQPAAALAATPRGLWHLASLSTGSATAVSPRKPEMQDRHLVVCNIARLAQEYQRSQAEQSCGTDDELGSLYSQWASPPPVKPAVYAMNIANSNTSLSLSSDEYDANSASDEHELLHAPAPQPRAWQLPSLLTAVFDGHRGCLAANTAVSNLSRMVLSCTQLWSKLEGAAHAAVLPDQVVQAVKSALHQVFMKVDEEIKRQMLLRGTLRHDGATALLGLQVGQHLFVANAGDSRAVLSRRGAAIRLSTDHTPELEEEKARIIANGGSVRMYKGAWRVVLDRRAHGGAINMCAVSRALGDLDYKQPTQLITAAPDVSHIQLQPLHDHFVVYASDGVWAHLTDQEAVNLVQAHMVQAAAQNRSRAEQAEAAAKALVRHARAHGSLDDITAVVTPLDWACA